MSRKIVLSEKWNMANFCLRTPSRKRWMAFVKNFTNALRETSSETWNDLWPDSFLIELHFENVTTLLPPNIFLCRIFRLPHKWHVFANSSWKTSQLPLSPRCCAAASARSSSSRILRNEKKSVKMGIHAFTLKNRLADETWNVDILPFTNCQKLIARFCSSSFLSRISWEAKVSSH